MLDDWKGEHFIKVPKAECEPEQDDRFYARVNVRSREQRAKELWERGASINEIACDVGLSYQAARGALIRLKLLPEPKKRKKENN